MVHLLPIASNKNPVTGPAMMAARANTELIQDAASESTPSMSQSLPQMEESIEGSAGEVHANAFPKPNAPRQARKL